MVAAGRFVGRRVGGADVTGEWGAGFVDEEEIGGVVKIGRF